MNKVKLKVIDALKAYGSLMEIKDREDLPILLSFKIAKLFQKLNEEKIHFENQKIKLVRKYGEPVKESNQIKVRDKLLDKYQTELEEILSEEIIIDSPEIDINLFSDIKVKPSILEGILVFISENNKLNAKPISRKTDKR